jgi:hypothetical protein
MRDGHWKLLMNPDRSKTKLFDLTADPGEKNNLATTQPDELKRMQGQLSAWWTAMNHYHDGH